MLKLRKKELTIGLTVICALAFLFFGINYLKGVNVFRAANYYYATFHSVEGLAQSAPVTLNGFKVGLVREMAYDYDHPGNIKVEMSLDKQLKVTEGTRAVLVTDLLGTASIDLRLGPGPGYCKVGDTLPGEVASGLMQSVSENILPSVAQLAPKVDSLLTALIAVASNPALSASLQSIEQLTANLEASSVLLHRALGPTPGIVNDASLAMADVKAIAANLNKVSADLMQLSQSLANAPIDSIAGNVNLMAANLAALSKRLDSPDSSLGRLLNDPALYDNLNACAAHLDSILIDLKRQPKRYIPPIKIF